MPTQTINANAVYIRATSNTITSDDGWTYDVRNRDDENWIRVGTGMAITATYNDWAWDTNQTGTGYTAGARSNNWAWHQTMTTSATYTIQAWDQQWDQVRAIRAQSNLQRAMAAARGAGDMLHEWSVGDWAADCDVDLEDFSDEESGLVMETYLHHWASAQQARRRREEAAELAARAKHKAERLLVSLLSADQKREWLEHHYVTERAPSGRRWRFYPVRSGGAMLMNGETNERRATLCVHPRDLMPNEDVIAGLLLALRNGDEDHVLSIANLHAGFFTDEENQIRRVGREQLIRERRVAAA